MSFNWSNASYDAWATREPWGNAKEPEMNDHKDHCHVVGPFLTFCDLSAHHVGEHEGTDVHGYRHYWEENYDLLESKVIDRKEPIMATCEECKQEMPDNLGKWTGFVGTDGVNEYIDFYCNDCIDHHSNNDEDDYEEYMEEIRLSKHDL